MYLDSRDAIAPSFVNDKTFTLIPKYVVRKKFEAVAFT